MNIVAKDKIFDYINCIEVKYYYDYEMVIINLQVDIITTIISVKLLIFFA